jgi:hypothetical protein
VNDLAKLTAACEALVGMHSCSISVFEASDDLLNWALENGGHKETYRANKTRSSFWTVRVELHGVHVTLFKRPTTKKVTP